MQIGKQAGKWGRHAGRFGKQSGWRAAAWSLASVILAAGIVGSGGAGQAAEVQIPLTEESQVHLASPAEAAAVLQSRDEFTGALSQFDLQSRLLTAAPVTLDQLLEFAAQQARPWQEAEVRKLQAAIAAVGQRLRPFELPLPRQILLLKTTGREEGNAAYCRGNAIVLPQRLVDQPQPALERLLVHELFHILSRQKPDLRDQLYAIVGFHPCQPVQLPATLRDRQITNPDGPLARHFIRLEHAGKTVAAVPILYSSDERYDPAKGGPFFRFLVFRMLVVTIDEDRAEPALEDGQPVLIDARQNASFFRQVGRNTSYILHPDEILADNFVHLVQGTEQLQSPEIVERMRELLTANK
ncbi:MAG: hypothetical protein J5I93_06125 [Pirellulaceae bacterium]|nr:hypothetical protein [Pirellulaceae bacterium]